MLLWRAWVSSTLIQTTAHVRGIIVSEYLQCIYASLLVFVAHMFLRSMHILKWSMYSGILMCFMCVIVKTLEQQEFELLIVCHEDYWWRGVGECADTLWYKQIEPKTYLNSGAVCSGLQLASNTCEMPSGLTTAVLWRSCQHRHNTELTVPVTCSCLMLSRTM